MDVWMGKQSAIPKRAAIEGNLEGRTANYRRRKKMDAWMGKQSAIPKELLLREIEGRTANYMRQVA